MIRSLTTDIALGDHISKHSTPSEYEQLLDSLARMQDGLIADTLRLGTDLVAEIQSEPDFPPHYLTNISAKMDQVRAGLRLADAKASKLRERSEYASSKDRYSWLPDVYSQISRLCVFCSSGCQMLSHPFLALCPHALHPGAIHGKEGIKFCHLATLQVLRRIRRPWPQSPGARVLAGEHRRLRRRRRRRR